MPTSAIAARYTATITQSMTWKDDCMRGKDVILVASERRVRRASPPPHCPADVGRVFHHYKRRRWTRRRPAARTDRGNGADRDRLAGDVRRPPAAGAARRSDDDRNDRRGRDDPGQPRLS